MAQMQERREDGQGREALERAVRALVARQTESGSWDLDYSGALFLTPMFVMASHITGYELSDEDREGFKKYLLAQQNEDGGFGLHVEGPSFVFTTTLTYVALRLLGVEADEAPTRRALAWLRQVGGALSIPSWGKFVLCLMGLYEYSGMNPVLPELWLLPKWVPIQPGNLWCHCRVVYLPMSYLYGIKARTPSTPLLEAIRDELYDGGYDAIDWPAQRNNVARTDLHTPHNFVLDTVNTIQEGFERRVPRRLRQKALDEVLDHIHHEDITTHYIDIGPVNKLFNAVCWQFADNGEEELRKHHERFEDYLWRSDEGIKVQGYNSTELWDSAFALQAIAEARLDEQFADALLRGHRFIDENQIREDVSEREKYYREPSKGGWPFSNVDHGWPITDCTAEGLEVALDLADLVGCDPISDDRLLDAVGLILYWQNKDGGWASYERKRGSKLLELLNPSEVFGAIMIDYSYTECSAACIRALSKFRQNYPGVLREEIDEAVMRGREFLLSKQKADGSWYGSWGVCFTYGTWFGVWGLRAAGLPAEHPAIERACRFLEKQQRSDGGWGEHFSSCHEARYVQAEQSLVVNTAWALLSLMRGGSKHRESVERGIEFLRRRQNEDGSWPKEAMAGVFNHTCMLNYDLYYQTFPTWALALYEQYRSESV